MSKYVCSHATSKYTVSVMPQVYSLPGLELLLAQRMEACLGFPWPWAPDQAHQLPVVCAAAADGQLAIVRVSERKP